MDNRLCVDWDYMRSFLTDAFTAYGVPKEDAVICADVLLESDRRGIESHGCNRFKPIYIDRIKNGTLLPVTNIETVRETPNNADAHPTSCNMFTTPLFRKQKSASPPGTSGGGAAVFYQ